MDSCASTAALLPVYSKRPRRCCRWVERARAPSARPAPRPFSVFQFQDWVLDSRPGGDIQGAGSTSQPVEKLCCVRSLRQTIRRQELCYRYVLLLQYSLSLSFFFRQWRYVSRDTRERYRERDLSRVHSRGQASFRVAERLKGWIYGCLLFHPKSQGAYRPALRNPSLVHSFPRALGICICMQVVWN